MKPVPTTKFPDAGQRIRKGLHHSVQQKWADLRVSPFLLHNLHSLHTRKIYSETGSSRFSNRAHS